MTTPVDFTSLTNPEDEMIQSLKLLIGLIPALPGMALLVGAPLPETQADESALAAISNLRAEHYTLSNGLRVVLCEDHSSPVVAVHIVYHVGSKNDNPERTGFAHLFEHLMFQGSQNSNRDYLVEMQKIGADFNGGTGADTTSYHQVVPSNALEFTLWMEADRMGFLVPALTQEKLNNQRDVVKNEVRQALDAPYTKVYLELIAQLYPPLHPYSWTNAGRWDKSRWEGEWEDIDAITLDEAKEFHRAYYAPHNASLCLVGDFKTDEAKAWIEKYFGGIPSGPMPVRIKAMPFALTGEKRVTCYDRVELPALYLAWPTMPAHHPDEAPLRILMRLLAETRISPLQQRLLYDKQICHDFRTEVSCNEIAGHLIIAATPREGFTLADIQKVIEEEIARFQAAPPPAEDVARARNAIEKSFIYGSQTMLDKASRFNHYNLFHGTPNYAEQDLQRYLKVTPRDVQRVAAKYLTGNRLHFTVLPAEKLKVSENLSANNVDRSQPPPLGPTPTVTFPVVERFTLSNGLEVRVVERNDLPMAQFNLVVKSGLFANPPERPGIVSMATALMTQGTKRWNAEELSKELDSLGIGIGVGAGWKSTDVTMHALTRHLDRALEIFADVLVNPTFPQEELERVRQQWLASMAKNKYEPHTILHKARTRVIFGEKHLYGVPSEQTETSLTSITREDLQKFHSTYIRPNNAALVVVGDVKVEALRKKLERVLAAWKPAPVPPVTMPTRWSKEGGFLVLGNKGGVEQSIISLGALGPPQESEDRVALQIANYIIGGSYNSRLNLKLRQEKGFTYGAYSFFDFRPVIGMFGAGASVNTPDTQAALADIMAEFRGLETDRPITPAELQAAQDSLCRSFVGEFQTNGQIAGHIAHLVRWELPDDYYKGYVDRIRAVTLEDVHRVVRKYLDPQKLIVFVVGDLRKIESSLSELQIGDIKYVNPLGELVDKPPVK